MSCSRRQHGDPTGARTPRPLDPESEVLTTRQPRSHTSIGHSSECKIFYSHFITAKIDHWCEGMWRLGTILYLFTTTKGRYCKNFTSADGSCRSHTVLSPRHYVLSLPNRRQPAVFRLNAPYWSSSDGGKWPSEANRVQRRRQWLRVLPAFTAFTP